MGTSLDAKCGFLVGAYACKVQALRMHGLQVQGFGILGLWLAFTCDSGFCAWLGDVPPLLGLAILGCTGFTVL